MIITDKIPLKPNNKQKTLFKKHAGYARVAYNWGVDECKRALSNKEIGSTNKFRLITSFNSVKTFLFPWSKELSQNTPKHALKDLSVAWTLFWHNRDKKSIKPPRNYKSKKHHMSFGIDNGDGEIEVKDRKVKLPKIGWVTLSRNSRFSGTIKKCTIKFDGFRWYTNLVFEIPDPLEKFDGEILGIDVGLRTLSTAYNGVISRKFDVNRINSVDKKLRRVNKAISRSQNIFGINKSSKRREKLYYKRRKLYREEENYKNENHNIIAKAITKQAKMLVLETLNINYMRRYRRLSKSFHKKAIGKFLSILKWQALKQSVKISYVDKFFPSSRLCSSCGRKNTELGLEAEWECLSCGVVHDRDVNAAINLYRQGLAVS